MPRNLIFILADDLGWRDLGCYGSSFYETPHLDQLARRSVTFTHAYAACPVCSPTRASILTGKYPANVGVTRFIGGNDRGRLIGAPYIDHLPQSETSLATALREGGYQTWHVGKWHLGSRDYWPDRHGFDVNVGGCDWGMPKKGYFSPWQCATVDDAEVPEGVYLDDYLTDRAIDLIRNRDRERPFFLNLWPYLVHTPIEAPAETVEKYRRKAERLGLDQLDPFVPGEHFPVEHKRQERVVRRMVQSDPVYAAMIERLDANIGRVLAALDEEGIADQTAVFFTSDNGGLSTAEGSPTTNLPLSEGKGWMYDGGIREPLIAHVPGLTPEDADCHVPITSPDFYPTLLELAELPERPDQHEDGYAFTTLLTDPEADHDRPPLFWHFPHYGNQGGTPGCAIRAGEWKLIEFFEDNRIELYHLVDDPSEAFNLAESQPRRAEKLHRQLIDWRRRMDAKIPAVNPDFTEDSDPAADPRI